MMLHELMLFLTCTLLRPLLAFHPEMFVKNLKYMGLGMFCIIVVMAVIIGVVMLLNKASARAAQKKAAEEDQSAAE